MFKRIKNKITSKMQNAIQKEVDKFEIDIVDKVLARIEYLALNTGMDLEQIFEDIKNGGYKNDKKEHIQND